MSARVLVTGGRDFADRAAVFGALDNLHAERWIDRVIEGGAGGADRLAYEWCVARRVECWHCPADWKAYGKAAGPIRNAKMIAEGKPDVVLAFPGGRGTADCIRQAEAAHITVVRVGSTPPRPNSDGVGEAGETEGAGRP